MSYTAYPSVSRTTRGRGARGRGRGRGIPPTTNTKQSEEAATEGATAQERSPDKTQRRDAYTVFMPDEKRRNKIQQGAQKEEANYKKYKDSQKLGHVSYVGTIGGGLTQSESIQQRHAQQRYLPSPSRRAALHKANQRKSEEENDQRKKEHARKKTESNETRNTDRQARLDADRRRVNEDFLRRLEGGSK